MAFARFAVITELLIPDMLLKPVGWFTPSPAYTYLPNTEYTLDLIGSSATSATVVVLVSATAGVYHFVYLTPTPTARQAVFTTTASPSVLAFNMYANNINLTGVKLSYDVANVIFSRSPQRPEGSYDIIQAQRATSAGVRHAYDHTITQQVITLKLRMTTAEKDDLLAFFNSTVKGMADSFSYVNPAGETITVRFDSPRLDGLQEKAYDSWEITVGLRVFP